MTNRITLTIQDRVVYWETNPNVIAVLAQHLVSTLGPAEEDE